MSCNKTKRQKSMIYDKKSDILPRLCFGLIYPPQKKRKPRDAEAFAFLCRFWMHMMNYQYLARLLGKGGAKQRFALLNSPTTRYGRGINTYAKHVCWRRRDRGRTLFAREMLKITFSFIALFTDEKRGKSQQG